MRERILGIITMQMFIARFYFIMSKKRLKIKAVRVGELAQHIKALVRPDDLSLSHVTSTVVGET